MAEGREVSEVVSAEDSEVVNAEVDAAEIVADSAAMIARAQSSLRR